MKSKTFPGSATPAITLDWLHARVRKDDEFPRCLIWVGYMDGKAPTANVDGQPLGVRRLVFKLRNKREPAPGMIVTTTCQTPGCVWCVTEDTFSSRNKRRGPVTLAERRRLAEIGRARSHLDMQAIQDIRQQEAKQEVYAERYGISRQMVSLIQRGKWWRDYSSPFTQLTERA